MSAAGHLRQNRFFAEAELTHKLDRLVQEGFGPLALLNDLPFKLRNFGYMLIYRGEYEGVYDYGPAEYRTAYQYFNQTLVPHQPDSAAHMPTSATRASTLRNVRSAAQSPLPGLSRGRDRAICSSASAARSSPGARPTSSACSTTSTRSTTASAAS